MAANKIFDLLDHMDSSAREAWRLAVQTRHLGAGQILYAQGEAGSSLFRVVSGQIRLFVARPDGRELYYVLLGPGDCFGESNVVDGRGRPQTAEARSEVMLEVLGGDACERLCREHPSFSRALMRLLACHMRVVIDLLADASLNDLPERVARRILAAVPVADLASRQGTLPVNLSQSDLAKMVGASRQSVNKVLQQFQEEALITTEYGRLTVHALDRLRQRAQAGGLSTS